MAAQARPKGGQEATVRDMIEQVDAVMLGVMFGGIVQETLQGGGFQRSVFIPAKVILHHGLPKQYERSSKELCTT